MHTIKSNTMIGLSLYLLMWITCWQIHLYGMGQITALANSPMALTTTQKITYTLIVDAWPLITLSLAPIVLAGVFFVRPVLSSRQTRLVTWLRPASVATILYVVMCLVVTFLADDLRTTAALETIDRQNVVAVVPPIGQWGRLIETSQAFWAPILCAGLFAGSFAKFRNWSVTAPAEKHRP